jgi:hypothetical protein
MRRVPASTAIAAIGTMLASTCVCAREPDDQGSDRAGFYVRTALAGGYSGGTYAWTGLSLAGFGPVHEIHLEKTLHGLLLDAQAAIGTALIPGLALAAKGGLWILPLPGQDGPLGATTIDLAAGADLGVLVDIFPIITNPMHVQAGASIQWATFASETNSIGSADNIVKPEPVSGPRGSVGIGYMLTARVDLLVRASYASLNSDHSTYHPLSVALEVGLLSF